MGEATRNDRSKAHTHLLKVCPIVVQIVTASGFLSHFVFFYAFVRFRLQNWTQTLAVLSATLDIITRRWLVIMCGHVAATRKPLTWTLTMPSPGLLRWISV